MVPGDDAGAPSYLLDTNILVAYIRAGALGAYIEAKFALKASPYKPLISIVSVGEILALVRKFGWDNKKVATMRSLLRELIWIDINDDQVLEVYAELAEVTRTGETINQNDIWIAATAKVTGATLLTTDKHFAQFESTHLRCIWIDEQVVRRQEE
jgi:tRNA(fMet)-specific endonuclease VapC